MSQYPAQLVPGGVDLDINVDGYRVVRDIPDGVGNTGITRVLQREDTCETFAGKYIAINKVNEDVRREIEIHYSLDHPNIVRFHECKLTRGRNFLVIIMEYLGGGELFKFVMEHGGLSEQMARYFFQQLICGLDYMHRNEICHRDIKLENTLLSTDQAPRLKICDFEFAKRKKVHSAPDSHKGTLPYTAPEAFTGKPYEGKPADVWSCGVFLYAMLIGRYPFEDLSNPGNMYATITNLKHARYDIPEGFNLSQEGRDILSKMIVADPNVRLSVEGIRQHPWFVHDLPGEFRLPGCGGGDMAGRKRQMPLELSALLDSSVNDIFQPPGSQPDRSNLASNPSQGEMSGPMSFGPELEDILQSVQQELAAKNPALNLGTLNTETGLNQPIKQRQDSPMKLQSFDSFSSFSMGTPSTSAANAVQHSPFRAQPPAATGVVYQENPSSLSSVEKLLYRSLLPTGDGDMMDVTEMNPELMEQPDWIPREVSDFMPVKVDSNGNVVKQHPSQ